MNKNKHPLVSVVIPLYNQKGYVAEAIDSILNQTYAPIEIIVVNDGSTDNPLPILEKYRGKILLINQENRGLAAARNAGIGHARGEYLQFLDADDWLDPDKIKLQLEFMEKSRAAVSYCEILQYEQESGRSQLRYIGPLLDMFAHLYNLWHPYPLPVHGVLMKRELFDRFGPFAQDLTACEDRHLFSRMAVSGVVFHYFPFIGGSRRIHGASMNRDRFHIVGNILGYYLKLNAELGEDYFVPRCGRTGYELMCANLTYLYLLEIGRGASGKELRFIRRLMKENRLRLFAAAIPSAPRRFKVPLSLLKAYINRFRVRLRSPGEMGKDA